MVCDLTLFCGLGDVFKWLFVLFCVYFFSSLYIAFIVYLQPFCISLVISLCFRFEIALISLLDSLLISL